ncbi:MAG: hypothetical protein DMG25_15975 [Acidobacteria bacterium]|nr:MAG: hypothetical protein DMG25_15975 [Acidobacteriota bacterium]
MSAGNVAASWSAVIDRPYSESKLKIEDYKFKIKRNIEYRRCEIDMTNLRSTTERLRPTERKASSLEFGISNLEFRNHFATLLSARVPAVRRGAQDLYEIPIALKGRWVKGGREFSITSRDLEAMARNFEKRKNDQVVIDYEHASEAPEVALGGPVPAAGWIHELGFRVSGLGVREKSAGLGAQGSASGQGEFRAPEPRTPDTGHRLLYALVEWTKEALGLIKSGAYRFFSPSIDWNYRDKATGEPQGATLTSGALTNHPFLEELPPIMLTDLVADRVIGSSSHRAIRHSEPLACHSERSEESRSGFSMTRSSDHPPALCAANGITRLTALPALEGETEMKQLTLKKLDDGPHAGHHGVFDEDEPLGFIDAGEFADYAQQHLDGGADAPNGTEDASTDCPSQKLAERLGVAPSTTFDEIRRRLEAVDQAQGTEAGGRAVLLSEAVKSGVLDNARAAALAREGRITLADYIAAQEAEKRLDEAVRAGKILPRDRKFFFRDALERPREFDDYVKRAVPSVRLGSVGLGSTAELSVDDEVRVRTERLVAEEHLSYSKALKKALASDRELDRRYRAAHRRRLLGDIDSEAAGITQ